MRTQSYLVAVCVLGVLATPVAAMAECELADRSCSAKVSLISLVANPERWTSKRVAVSGYVVLKSEGTVLFLQPEDRELGILANGIWLRISEESQVPSGFKSGWARVIGVFDSEIHGHLGAFPGAIVVEHLSPI
jgi:hypothetical protein